MKRLLLFPPRSCSKNETDFDVQEPTLYLRNVFYFVPSDRFTLSASYVRRSTVPTHAVKNDDDVDRNTFFDPDDFHESDLEIDIDPSES